MRVFTTLLLLSPILLLGQSVEGIWFDKQNNNFMENNNGICNLAYIYYPSNDTVTTFTYNPTPFKYKNDSEILTIIFRSYHGPIRLWARNNKANFQIIELSNEKLVILPYSKNIKESSITMQYFGSDTLEYKRLSKEKYSLICTGCNN